MYLIQRGCKEKKLFIILIVIVGYREKEWKWLIHGGKMIGFDLIGNTPLVLLKSFSNKDVQIYKVRTVQPWR